MVGSADDRIDALRRQRDEAIRDEELAAADFRDALAEAARTVAPIVCTAIGVAAIFVTADIVCGPDPLLPEGDWGVREWIISAVAGALGWAIVQFGSGNFGIRPEDR